MSSFTVNWFASSLNPWHEESKSKALINIDSLILAFPERWFFGRENTGDIFDLESLFDTFEEKVHLATSDGGFDCSAEPEKQEEISAELKMAEYQGLISRLALHGCAVLKLFACCHESTLQILESSANGFEAVYVTKPASSKAGNSEIYLVMIGFLGQAAAELKPNTHSFLAMAFPIINHFITRQKTAISDNLQAAPNLNADSDQLVEAVSRRQFTRWNLKGKGLLQKMN